MAVTTGAAAQTSSRNGATTGQQWVYLAEDAPADNKVTIRDRDSMDQSRFGRVPIEELRGWLDSHLDY